MRTKFDGEDNNLASASSLADAGGQGVAGHSDGVQHRPLLLKHQWTLAQIEAYLLTWSSLVSYKEKHTDDVVQAFMNALSARLEGDGVKVREGATVEVAWRMGMLSGKKAM